MVIRLDLQCADKCGRGLPGLVLVEVRTPEVVVGLAGARVQPQGCAEGLYGRGSLAPMEEDAPEVDVGTGQLWRYLQCPAGHFLRFLKLFLTDQDRSQSGQNLGEVRVELQCTPALLQCLGDLIPLEIYITKVSIGPGMPREEGNGLLIGGNSLLGEALFHEGYPQVVVGLGIVGMIVERDPVLRDGLVDPPLPPVGYAKEAVYLGHVRTDLEDLPALPLYVGVAFLFQIKQGQHDVDIRLIAPPMLALPIKLDGSGAPGFGKRKHIGIETAVAVHPDDAHKELIVFIPET